MLSQYVVKNIHYINVTINGIYKKRCINFLKHKHSQANVRVLFIMSNRPGTDQWEDLTKMKQHIPTNRNGSCHFFSPFPDSLL